MPSLWQDSLQDGNEREKANRQGERQQRSGGNRTAEKSLGYGDRELDLPVADDNKDAVRRKRMTVRNIVQWRKRIQLG